MTRRVARRGILATVLLIWAGAVLAPPGEAADEAEDDGSFGFSTPVACSEIRGFEDYDALPIAALTADEKLSIYFRPRHYKWTLKGEKYNVHFAEESQVRRRGQKGAALIKFKPMEFKDSYPRAPENNIYLSNKISLKGLKPGDYDYEIILRDRIGDSAPATRIMPFTVVAPGEKKDEPGTPP